MQVIIRTSGICPSVLEQIFASIKLFSASEQKYLRINREHLKFTITILDMQTLKTNLV